ncbi:MAG: glycerol-3-phosphate 1-O-acyltransferase PlsY [Helicobacter sp.]|nr:glycerol-3-phosphate 1-O-acyltransferase PlsY [Helicobacter sp.]
MLEGFLSFFTNINGFFYILGYLIGGIPFGYLLVFSFYKVRLTQVGSKSVGATNVYRVLKDIAPNRAKKFMIATIFLDSTKGLFVILAAKLMGVGYDVQWLIAIFVVLGHCYSIFLFFLGGKGVTTAIGTTILLMPIEGIIGLIIWGLVGKYLKISSLSSLFGVLGAIICTFFIPDLLHLPEAINITKQIGSHTPVVIIGVIVLWTHLPNIYRLIFGMEQKIIG